MKTIDISRKQKRLQTWSRHAAEQGISEPTRQRFFDLLKLYRNTLARCWEDAEPAEDELLKLEDLERQLEALHAASRHIAPNGIASS